MIRQLDVPIYDTNVLFLLDVTGEEFAKFLDNEQNKSRITEEEIKSVFDDIKDDKWEGTLFPLDCGSYISLIKNAKDERCYTHELFHVADTILKDRGVEYTQNNEALAYMIGWINKQYSYLLKEFNEEKNENKGND